MADYSHHKYEITILADRIFRLNPFEGVEIEVEDFSTSEDARKLLASPEYTSTRFAAAFDTLTLANKILGNFFITFNKPATPTRLFNEEVTAYKWLQGAIEKA
jgi:hypothetical protein